MQQARATAHRFGAKKKITRCLNYSPTANQSKNSKEYQHGQANYGYRFYLRMCFSGLGRSGHDNFFSHLRFESAIRETSRLDLGNAAKPATSGSGLSASQFQGT